MCNFKTNCQSLKITPGKNIHALLCGCFLCLAILLLPACATTNTNHNTNQHPLEKADSDVSIGSENLATTNTASTTDGLSNESKLSKLEHEMRKDWGVEVIGIRQSAAGYMLDFRYRVLDAEKATLLLDRRIKPELKVAKSGATLKVPVPPKIGALRQSAKFVQAERNYFILFSNPGRHVMPGDKVSVVIGDFKAENLTVQ
jgi:hypothetical protein